MRFLWYPLKFAVSVVSFAAASVAAAGDVIQPQILIPYVHLSIYPYGHTYFLDIFILGRRLQTVRHTNVYSMDDGRQVLDGQSPHVGANIGGMLKGRRLFRRHLLLLNINNKNTKKKIEMKLSHARVCIYLFQNIPPPHRVRVYEYIFV